MWFLPILVVGAIAMALANRAARKTASPSRQLAAGPPVTPTPVMAGGPGIPGPISVLGEILRIGQTPPPTVILCAIAEAQHIGRNDLASDIVQAFVAPVVLHAQRARARCTRPINVPYERGSCEILRSPRQAAEAYSCAPVAPPLSCEFAAASTPPVPRAEAAAPGAPSDSSAQAPIQMPSMATMTSMDDEISALLNADPARFMEMVSRGTLPSMARAPQAQAPEVIPAPIAPAPVVSPPAEPTGLPPETVAQLQEAAGQPEAADRTRSLAPGSPIASVPDPAWREFVMRLEREAPSYSSQRHVGQYRQRRERLAELGINPSAIADSAQAQRTALDADLADAHRHGVASEMFAQHLGRPITVPGRESAVTVTLSGVLGVIQCAGLEGAAGWLERSNDRKRYPHTTQAFLHTNGVF